MSSLFRPPRSGIEWILAVQILSLALVFFLTPNPYFATHGGFGATDDAMAFHLGWVTMLPLSLVCAGALKQLRHSDLGLIAAFGLLFLVQVFHDYDPFSLAFPYLSLLGLKLYARGSGADLLWPRALVPILLLFLLGVLLASLRPGVWGSPAFAFSRTERGELTFNDFLGINFFATVFLVAQARWRPGTLALFFAFVLFVASFGSRRYLLLTLPGLFALLACLLFERRTLWQLFLALGVSTLLGALLYDKISAYAFTGYQGDISTGRFELWRYYWKLLAQHPVIGNGTQLEIPRYLFAKTEVGGLIAYSTRFGLLFGLWQCYYLAQALRASLRCLVTPPDRLRLFMGVVVIVGAPLYLIEGIYSVMDPAGMLFWYAVFLMSDR